MKIIICGATGFIGRNLVEYFNKNGNEIIAIFNKRDPFPVNSGKVKWIKADLRIPGVLKEHLPGTDVLLQFAATTSGAKDIIERPYIHVTDNAVINSYLLRECFEKKVRHFIFPSCTVMLSSIENQKESDWDPNNQIFGNYFGVGNTKIYIEKMCEFYSSLGLKTTALRHSNVYGKYDKFDLYKSHVLGATIRKVINAKENEVLEVWGSGKAKRDFIFVDDLVEMIEKSILNQSDSFGLYNCGMGYSISINDLVKKIIKISGKNLSIKNNIDKPDFPTALSLNCEKAFTELKWKVNTNLEEGLKKTYQWVNEN
ncbi:NAD(P)-dependent oxidoreductase [uncultured Prochlorococcus sp.]|uniref:NAD-dependent epimerase/dehydratase family protein n=1 Tax=uncultured Prochlorococcus sp. TaxID=159733 RepID=UPI002586F92B|nr:NAD(P)-dependent oxidoreductase [uncultured Prochlorococcus sp.]